MKSRNCKIIFAALAAAVALTIAPSLALAQLSSATPEYKCFVSRTDRPQTVIYFYDNGDLPDRFSDSILTAQAKIPNSIRDGVTEFHECALRELDFFDPIANLIESRIPQ